MLTPNNVLITTVNNSAKLNLTKKAKRKKHTRTRVKSQTDDYYKQASTNRTSIALNILTPERFPSRFSKYKELYMTPPNKTQLNLSWRALSLTSRINDENKIIKQKLKEYDQYDRAK